MTKKDFELIAAAIRELGRLTDTQREYVAKSVASRLAFRFPRFDAERFIQATR